MVGVSPRLCQANIIVESPLGHPRSKDSFIMPIMNGYFKHAQLCCSLAWLRSRSQHLFILFIFLLYNLNTDTHTHQHTRTLAISCLCCCVVLGELSGRREWIQVAVRHQDPVGINKTNCKITDFLRRCTSICLLLM